MKNEALNGREILGTLSGRLTHALSNCMTALSGDLLVATWPTATDRQKAEGLKGALDAARKSAEILNEFSDVCRGLSGENERLSLGEFVRALKSWRPNWEVGVGPGLAENEALCLAGPWKSLEFSLNAMAEVWGEGRGEISLELTDAQRPMGMRRDFTARKYLKMSIAAGGAKAIDWEQNRQSFKNWKLTAAFEIFAQFGGRPENADGRTQVFLPLADQCVPELTQ